MSAWLKRFGLHLAAAVGATGIFVAAAAVGATQTRQQVVIVSSPAPTQRTRTPVARKPIVVVATPTPVAEAEPAAPAADDASGQPTSVPSVSSEVPETAPLASNPPPQLPAQGAPQSGVANPPAPRPTPRATSTARPSPSPAPASPKVTPERSLAGSIRAVLPDGLDVLGVGGREWRVTPAPGALIRLNGKAARLDSLQVGDTVVILGQAPSGSGNSFVAHAITARRK